MHVCPDLGWYLGALEHSIIEKQSYTLPKLSQGDDERSANSRGAQDRFFFSYFILV